MYPIIVCEDDRHLLEKYIAFIEAYLMFHEHQFSLALATTNPFEVMQYLDNQHPNKGVYLLDIDLNSSIDGIDVAQAIRKADPQAKIIFISTHVQLAPLTLKRKVEAMYFIEKESLDTIREELFAGLSLAYERLNDVTLAQGNSFQFSVGSHQYVVNTKDIITIETSTIPHRLEMYTVDSRYDFYGKINQFESYTDLLRVAKSTVINPLHIKEVDYQLRLITTSDNRQIGFATRKVKELKETIAKLTNHTSL